MILLHSLLQPHPHTHLLYVQAGHIQVDYASFQAVHHTIAMVMGQKVSHDRCGKVTKAVHNNVRLQGLEEDTLSNHVLHQPSIQLVEQQVAAHTDTHREKKKNTHMKHLICVGVLTLSYECTEWSERGNKLKKHCVEQVTDNKCVNWETGLFCYYLDKLFVTPETNTTIYSSWCVWNHWLVKKAH